MRPFVVVAPLPWLAAGGGPAEVGDGVDAVSEDEASDVDSGREEVGLASVADVDSAVGACAEAAGGEAPPPQAARTTMNRTPMRGRYKTSPLGGASDAADIPLDHEQQSTSHPTLGLRRASARKPQGED